MTKNNNNKDQRGNSGSGGGGDGGNKPKCSKCKVNDAVHGGLVFTVEETGEQKTFYDKPLCDPCAEELSKCSECKTNWAKIISTKDNSEIIILCEECNSKTKKVQEFKTKLSEYLYNEDEQSKNGGSIKELNLEQWKSFKQLIEANHRFDPQEPARVIDHWTEPQFQEALRTFKVGGASCLLSFTNRRIKELEEQERKKKLNPPREEPEQQPKPNPPREEPRQQVNEPIGESTGTKCHRCQREFRDGEKFAKGSEGQCLCTSCVLEEYRCDGCFETSDLAEDEKRRAITLNEWIKNLKIIPESGRTIKLCPSCYQKRQENKIKYCSKCKKTKLYPHDPDPCDACRMKEAHECPSCGQREYYDGNNCMNCHFNDRQKENPNKNNSRFSDKRKHICEGCGISCWNEKENTYVWKTIRLWDSEHREEVRHFSYDCSCGEEFKKTKQQTCVQCQKREWPEMKKGWTLDYGLGKIFCSPICHMLYHKNLWEQEQRRNNRHFNQSYTLGDIPNTTFQSWVKNTKLYPMELELSSDGKKDFDWEKEGLKKEVLALKAMTKTLKKKSDTTTKTAEEAKLETYFLKLCQNTQQEAEQTFKNKYGQAELNALLTDSSQDQQPKKDYWPLIIGGGLALTGLIGGLVYYFWSKKKPLK